MEETTHTTPKPFIFVLMPFDARFSDIYKYGIKGAADEVAAYAERLDEQMFTEGMLDRIFNQISRADVIVADMTGRNPNVFYEVGYAHALGKIVLLLTQNADDIPFDLKHRAHTVYGGSIETLRKELCPRLLWAIAEAKRGPRTGRTEAISLRILEEDIPKGIVSETNAEVVGSVPSKTFKLPLQIRNDAFEELAPITHVYLFTEEASTVIPCIYRTHDFSSSVTSYRNWGVGAMPLPEPIEGFRANPIDCPDGLVQQFRLPTTVPGLPSGAVEIADVDFMFINDSKSSKVRYRIRLHTATQYHDFAFSLAVDIDSEPDRSEAVQPVDDDTSSECEKSAE